MAAPGNAAYAVIIPKAKVKAAETVAYLITSTEGPQPVITEFSISANGTAGFLLVEIVLGTNAGAGTFAETPTPVLIRGLAGSVARTAAKVNASAEPTVLTAIRRYEFPMPGGPLTLQLPLGREVGAVSLTAATSGSRIGIRCTPSTGEPEVSGHLEFEE